MRRAIITLLVLLSFGLKAQVYQAMPQAGYGPVKRMLFDSVLTIPLNINSLRNISGGRDAGQIRYNVTDSGLYVFTGYTWIKANLDSVNLSNRINGKLNITDTAYMLSWYMRKTDTLSLSNRINLRVKYTDTAAMLDPYLRKLDTASLSRRIDEKQNLITLTTNFKSGASTLIGSTLNIPKYSDTLQDNYVPYVGAIKDVDLGAYKLNANTLQSDYLLQVKNTPFSIAPTSDYTSITPDKTGFVFYTSWLQGQSTYTQSNRFNYANQAQQNNTREYNLPVRNGTLALVEDTVNLSNRINLKADKATTLTINGVGYDLSANRTWTIPTVDTTSLSNRINLKLNISDTASMLSPYLRKADTLSLSNRIDLKLNSADTSSLSNRINLKADKSTTLSINGTSYDLSANRSWTIPVVDTTSLSNRINLKVNISDTAAMLSPYLRKVDTTNRFLTSVSQPNDSTLSFVKGSTLTSYIIRASTQGSAVKLITNVYNNSGATILKGSVVYINGAHSSNLPTIALAIASTESTSAFTYGLVESDIPNNSAGTVVQNGVLTGLNLPTSSYTDGQTLYLSPTVLGGYTTTKVIAPNHYVAIGTVTRAHPNFGTIQIAIRNGFQLDELSDVKIAAVPLDSTVLQFSRVDSLWHDVSITSAIGSKYIKPTDTTSLSNRINAKADALSGTTNTVPKFTSSTTIGNSNIKDNGSAVSVNTTAGSFGALQVGSYNGNILMNTTNTNGGLIFQNTSSSNKLWDFSSDNNDLVFNESNVNPVMKLKAGGNVVISNLSGTGTRMVVADANGVLSSQAITGVDTTSLSNRINLKLNISDTASMLSGYQSAINSKQAAITLTTTGTSGAATFSSNTLNIPQYQAAGTYVTSVTGTSPIVSSGGTTPAISIPAATSSVNGYLSSTDWNTFNGKESVLTFSSPLVRTTNTISIPVATTSVNGYLSSTDWTTFNNKQSTLTNPVTGTGTNNYIAKFTATGSTIGNSVIYDDGKNAAIGTTSPNVSGQGVDQRVLTVQGTAGVWGGFEAGLTGNTSAGALNGFYGFTNASLSAGYRLISYIGSWLDGGGVTSGADMRFHTQANGTAGAPERMRIFSDGNILMQTGGTFSNAGYKLDVNGTGRFSTSSTDYALTLQNVQDGSQGLLVRATDNDGSLYLLNLQSSNAATSQTWVDRFVVTKQGNVGIGTTSPLTILHINSPASTNATIYFGVNGTMNGYLGQSASSGSLSNGAAVGDIVLRSQTNLLFTSGGDAERMRITSGGNILVGKTTKSARLAGATIEAEGTIYSGGSQGGYFFEDRSNATYWYGWYSAGNTNVFFYNGNAGANIASISPATGVYTPLSDINKKKGFELSTIGLNAILNLKPTLYRMKSESDSTDKHLGFIAQEVKEFIPQAYVESGEGKDKFIGLDYQSITATLVKAVQELSAKNEALIKRIETLENK